MPSRCLRPVLAASIAAGPLLCAAQARADQAFASPGIALQLSLGQRTRLGVLFDFRGGWSYESGHLCGDRDVRRQAPVGGFAQMAWLWPGEITRFAAGMFAGSGSDTLVGTGELALSHTSRIDDALPGGLGIQAGVVGAGVNIIEVAIRGNFSFGAAPTDLSLSIGGRLPGRFGESCAIPGRPLRVDGGVLGSRLLACVDEAADPAALAWALDAGAEAASVPAFLALARDLAAAGAPAMLVERARAAAWDELRHTELCLLAARSLGRAQGLELPAVPAPRRESPAALLERLAIESFLDGCVGEGAAARRAAVAARTAVGALAQIQAAIAGDEAAHAALGWDVLAFCVARGGGRVRDALSAAIAASVPPVTSEGAADDRGRAGRVAARVANDLAAETLAGAIRRARQLALV